jgi:uncharacterized protein (TIGR00375 family)
MQFIADLHIHSKFSRATAKDLDLENLHLAAQKKGITVIGTGDFTHPDWHTEIKEKLVPAEEGLFKLKDSLRHLIDPKVPPACRREIRFMLVSEISNIYKKDGKTRKIHNLVFFPDMESVEKFNHTLEKIGNIKSDGRPILGLDAKNLLEIVCETSIHGFLIPAHIWTPWFSILGSKSGFDSIEECFEDLTSYIFAVETGLSSDPAMNWRISGLDGFTLVSNSDAHSPAKLGREANLFNTELSYPAIKAAIHSGDPKRFLGTFEFYPEEGKYHLDGHRKCNVRLWPQKTLKRDGICPKCKKPVTLGVLYRVEELADRPKGLKPRSYHPYYNIIPLTEVLSEILMVGPGSKKVRKYSNELLEKYGPEIKILHFLESQILDDSGIPLLGEAIRRMRSGKIELSPGYDGEFGKIKIFKPSEREILLGQKPLFLLPGKSSKTIEPKTDYKKHLYKTPGSTKQTDKMITNRRRDKTVNRAACGDGTALNREQGSAVEHPANTLLIVAGPGTGKTLTLTHRIAYLIAHKNVSPPNILALTFTHQAARQMHRRLRMLLPEGQQIPLVTTFHSFCYQILQETQTTGTSILIADDFDQKYLIHKALEALDKDGVKVPFKPQEILDKIISAKQQILHPQDNLESVTNKSDIEIFAIVYQAYQKLLSISGYYDYEDLIFKIVRRLETDDNIRKKIQNRFQFILVDEYQDLNHGQYRIVRALSPPGRNLFVIGDPDQSIYGFRGSEVRYFEQFLKDYPDAEVIHLKRNYRSTQTILDAAIQVMAVKNSSKKLETKIYSKIEGVKTLNVIEAVSEKAEAVSIGKYIEKMVGGIGFYSIDFDKIDTTDEKAPYSFSDFAVLYRTRHQGEIIAEVFHKAGIPCQVVSREDALHKKGIADLLSVMRVFESIGSYLDFERMIKLTSLNIGEKSMANFTAWGLQNKWKFSQALQNFRCFPIRGMKKNVQQKFFDVSTKLSQIKGQVWGLNIEKKLRFILENRVITPTAEGKARLEAAFNNSSSIFQKFDTHKPDFLSKIGLASDTDIYNPQTEKVALLTMHAAKGLEFPVVFISGCENGFIPFQRTGEASAVVNEERRLFYVALTRARERLFLSYAKKRRIHGKTVTRQLSPFIKDIKKQMKRYQKPKMPKTKDEIAVQLKLF